MKQNDPAKFEERSSDRGRSNEGNSDMQGFLHDPVQLIM